jgi:hypothetical protein
MNYIKKFLDDNNIKINEPFYLDGVNGAYSFDEKYHLQYEGARYYDMTSIYLLANILSGKRRVLKDKNKRKNICDYLEIKEGEKFFISLYNSGNSEGIYQYSNRQLLDYDNQPRYDMLEMLLNDTHTIIKMKKTKE